MNDFDLDRPATVLWHPRVLSHGQVDRGESRHFESLRNAIQFVMEDIPFTARGTALILFDQGSIEIDEIQLIYKRI